MQRTVRRMAWILLTVFLLGCGAETSMIEITYPPQTTMEANTVFSASDSVEDTEATDSPALRGDYVLNTSSKKFHDPACSSVGKIKESNRGNFTGERQELLTRGYEPCKICNP